MEMVMVTLPKHVDKALQEFLDHEVVRLEDAPSFRYEDEHIQEVKRLRHAFEGGIRVPVVVINMAENAAPNVVYPENARQILIDWNEIERASSTLLIEKLVDEIQTVPGLEESDSVQNLLTELRERIHALKQEEG